MLFGSGRTYELYHRKRYSLEAHASWRQSGNLRQLGWLSYWLLKQLMKEQFVAQSGAINVALILAILFVCQYYSFFFAACLLKCFLRVSGLLDYQKRQLDVMFNEITELTNQLDNLRTHVNKLENDKNRSARAVVGGHQRYSRLMEIQKIREDVRQMHIDCVCLNTEVELNNNKPLTLIMGNSLMSRTTDATPIAPPPRSPVTNGTGSPPPIPPRPNPQNLISRPPQFGILYQRVPPPQPPFRVISSTSSKSPSAQPPGQAFKIGGMHVHWNTAVPPPGSQPQFNPQGKI